MRAQCNMGVEHDSDGKTGVFPCWFHVHPKGFTFYKKSSDGKWIENRIADECYMN
jgi:hypothetical protein